jgi:predicted esterase
MNDYQLSPLFEARPPDTPASTPRAALVLLHGRDMQAETLRPFVQALGLPLAACVPHGPCPLADGSRAWWPATEGANGGEDLVDRAPPRREVARERLADAMERLRTAWPGLPMIVAGFSQGGMLALDQVLLGPGPRPDGLMLIGSSRIARGEWMPHWERVRGLPVAVLHGRLDEEIPMAAGHALFEALHRSGAAATWQVHDGGHEIPLLAWRALRRFIAVRAASARSTLS